MATPIQEDRSKKAANPRCEPLQILFNLGSLYIDSSGPYLSLTQTAYNLHERGHEVAIVGTKDHWRQEAPTHLSPIQAYAFSRLGPKSFHFLPTLPFWLRHFDSPDVISLQGIWMYSSAQIGRWARRKSISYMITAHGNFNPIALKVSAWKKGIARKLYVENLIKGAACFQAANEAEYRAMRNFGITKPICVIPNGINLPNLEETQEIEPVLPQSLLDKRTCLYVGRLHPIKGLEELLTAWSRLKHFHYDWQLVIAGPDSHGYRSKLETLITQEEIEDSVHLIGYVSDKEKAAWFRSSDLYILPSHSEGFAMTPLEAMSYGIPALLTPACNFPEAFEAGGALRITPIVEGICEGLEYMCAQSREDLCKMGAKARELIRERYNWDVICQDLEAVFEWMIGKSPPPNCLHFD